jgi:hypothetical protein
MGKEIAFCGLDCNKCQARIATIKNDNRLRKEVAEKWSKLNGVEITPEMIKCTGCKSNGVKTYFCSNLCEIRKCAINEKHDTCGSCAKLQSCQKIRMILDNNEEAKNNLQYK